MNTVGVIGGRDVEGCLAVLTALAQSCGLSLQRVRLDEAGACIGCIVLGSSPTVGTVPALRDRSILHVFLSPDLRASASVSFGSSGATPQPFRARTLVSGGVVPKGAARPPGEVVAAVEGQPVWVSTAIGEVRHDTCWVPDPWIKPEDCVSDHLSGKRFLNLLPVLEWLRSLSDFQEWQQPALRACFMIDDPNLHGTRYGFVGFEHLAAEGRRHHYHSAFATIPLDGYYVNRSAARIFRDNPGTLSLLMHGNNHTYRELAGRQPAGEQLALIRQAVHRITRLEEKSQVPVARVMAPPHGVCSAEMMAAMRAAGLEAVCVSHGSVWTGNPGAAWTVGLGTLPAMMVAGLSVVPRFGMDRHPENPVLLAAYLGQPIIPVGHHWDLADGTEILSASARCINGLGQVMWGDMTAIARSNYRSKIRGNVMRVQTFCRTTAVPVPEGITELVLEAPMVDANLETVECRVGGPVPSGQRAEESGSAWSFCVEAGTTVHCVVVSRNPAFCEEAFMLPKTPLAVIARKVLVELRDRSMPFLPRRYVRR